MFENVNGRTTVIDILIAHLRAFGSGELLGAFGSGELKRSSMVKINALQFFIYRLLEAWTFIEIITFHRDGGRCLLETTSVKKVIKHPVVPISR